MERRRALGMGHRRRQLRHLPQPHHGPVYRLSSQPSLRDERGVHGCLGNLQRKSCSSGERGHEDEKLTYDLAARFPLPLHFPMAQDSTSLPARQPRLGVPEIWSLDCMRYGYPERGARKCAREEKKGFWLGLAYGATKNGRDDTTRAFARRGRKRWLQAYDEI